MPTIVFHGDRDKLVNPLNGDQVSAQSKEGIELHLTIRRGPGPAVWRPRPDQFFSNPQHQSASQAVLGLPAPPRNLRDLGQLGKDTLVVNFTALDRGRVRTPNRRPTLVGTRQQRGPRADL
jgi:hypothetical protein